MRWRRANGRSRADAALRYASAATGPRDRTLPGARSRRPLAIGTRSSTGIAVGRDLDAAPRRRTGARRRSPPVAGLERGGRSWRWAWLRSRFCTSAKNRPLGGAGALSDPGAGKRHGRFSLSPDGRKLAFIAGGRLWVHSLESGESRDLTAAEAMYPSGPRTVASSATHPKESSRRSRRLAVPHRP